MAPIAVVASIATTVSMLLVTNPPTRSPGSNPYDFAEQADPEPENWVEVRKHQEEKVQVDVAARETWGE